MKRSSKKFTLLSTIEIYLLGRIFVNGKGTSKGLGIEVSVIIKVAWYICVKSEKFAFWVTLRLLGVHEARQKQATYITLFGEAKTCNEYQNLLQWFIISPAVMVPSSRLHQHT